MSSAAGVALHETTSPSKKKHTESGSSLRAVQYASNTASNLVSDLMMNFCLSPETSLKKMASFTAGGAGAAGGFGSGAGFSASS